MECISFIEKRQTFWGKLKHGLQFSIHGNQLSLLFVCNSRGHQFFLEGGEELLFSGVSSRVQGRTCFIYDLPCSKERQICFCDCKDLELDCLGPLSISGAFAREGKVLVFRSTELTITVQGDGAALMTIDFAHSRLSYAAIACTAFFCARFLTMSS